MLFNVGIKIDYLDLPVSTISIFSILVYKSGLSFTQSFLLSIRTCTSFKTLYFIPGTIVDSGAALSVSIQLAV